MPWPAAGICAQLAIAKWGAVSMVSSCSVGHHLKDLLLCRRVFLDTGKLLGVFIVGSVATVAATVLAFKLLPLASLG